jgi:hypothetical protein
VFLKESIETGVRAAALTEQELSIQASVRSRTIAGRRGAESFRAHLARRRMAFVRAIQGPLRFFAWTMKLFLGKFAKAAGKHPRATKSRQNDGMRAGASFRES